MGWPRAPIAQDAAERRHPPEPPVDLEDAIAFHASVDLGPDAELVCEMHLEPAGDAARGHPDVEQLVGAPEQRVHRLGGRALLQGPIGELREVPGSGRAFQGVAEVQPGMADADLGHDLERPAPGEQDIELGERLEAAADPRRRPADPLRDRLELAATGRDQGQDAIGFAVIEARQDDRIGRIAARDRHDSHGSTRRNCKVSAMIQASGSCVPPKGAGAVASPEPASNRARGSFAQQQATAGSHVCPNPATMPAR